VSLSGFNRNFSAICYKKVALQKKQNKRAYDFFDNIAAKYTNHNDEGKI
jgi:hypothetical protein